jgi:hypothetical protein
MIGCDKCEMWYHGPCVGVGKAAADAMDDYRCPKCARLACTPYAFGPPEPVAKLTRRPGVRMVRYLLAEVDEFGMAIREAALVQDALERAEAWRARARQHVAELEARARPAETTASLVQEGIALEVVPELLVRLQRHVQRCDEWSEALETLHTAPVEQKRGASVPTAAWEALHAAQALQAQAAHLHVTAAERGKLEAALQRAPAWQAAARALLAPGTRIGGAEGALLQLLQTSEAHISPEFEQIRLALNRHELLPDADEGVANAPDAHGA